MVLVYTVYIGQLHLPVPLQINGTDLWLSLCVIVSIYIFGYSGKLC